MGLFDGVATRGQSGFGSSAETAKRMGWPVVLVIDVGGQAQSAAATALGFKAYDPELPFAGVILNRVASPRHERLTRLGMERAGIKVLGSLPRRGDLALPERHLGLIQAVEHPDLEAAIAGYANFLRDHVDLDAIKAAALSGSAPTPQALPTRPPSELHWRETRRSPSPIRTSWRAGARLEPKFCRFRHLRMKPLPRTRIWSGCPVAIQNSMAAHWPQRKTGARVCKNTLPLNRFMANAVAIWHWARR